MSKSFKRTIACLLTVLMVVFSMPLTALAAPGEVADYAPDIDIQFSTYYNTADGLWNDLGTASASAEFDYCGLFDAPLEATISKDATTGSIKVSKLALTSAKTAAMAAYYECDPVDYTYAEGDIFLATVVVKNVTDVAFLSTALSYSGNIEPAGLYSYKNGRKTEYAWGSESERAAANSGTWFNGGTNMIVKQSGDTIYGSDLSNLAEDSYIDADEQFMMIVQNTPSGYYEQFAPTESPYSDVPFINPETGDDSGYTYEDTIILASFAFKITGEVSAANPIVFGVYDPDNTKFTQSYEGGSYTCADPKPKNYATYAEDTLSPASKKMTIFGMNINNGVTPVEHTHTYGDWAITWDANHEASAVRQCTDPECDDLEGSTQTATIAYTDDADTATCVDAGYIRHHATATYDGAEVATSYWDEDTQATGNHDYQEVEFHDATCTEGSYSTMQCTVCGDSYDTEKADDATGHDYQVATPFSWTADADSATATANVTCSQGDYAEVEDAVVTVSDDATKTYPATTSAPGKKTYIGTVRGVTDEYEVILPQLDKNWQFKEFQFSADGSTADVIYENADDPTETKVEATVNTTSAVKTPATCEAKGWTTYTATYAGETDSIDIEDIDALNHAWGAWTATWDGTNATVTRVCANDASHVQTADVTVTPSEDTATCEAGGEIVYTATATFEGAAIDVENNTKTVETSALGHDFTVLVEDEVAPTKTEDGRTAIYACSHGCGQQIGGEAIPATGLNVTIAKFDLGTVKKGADIYTTGAETTESYKFGATYTYTAEANEGATFVGWFVGNKLVSTSATYSNVAYADITITPVFSEDKADDITVVYYDKYGNVLSKYEGPADGFTPLAAEEVPAIAGYTFTKFSMTDEEIAAIKTEAKSATIFAQYEKASQGAYTVALVDEDGDEVTNAEITSKSGAENGALTYDEYVTVTAPGAAGFKVGEKMVAYGESYSFYIGSDVDLIVVYDAIADEEPSVNVVGHSKIADRRYNIVASRAVPSGWTAIDRGFLYGLNADAAAYADIDAPGTGVKVTHGTPTSSNEFGLNLTVSAGKAVKAKAFVVVKKGNTTKVVYSDLYEFVTE